jgi:xanthine dehydrogenase iron-sulfur cluster and FAD-binding subunit A
MTARYEGMEEYNGVKLHKITQTFEQPIQSYQDAFYQPTKDESAAVRVTKGVMKGTMTMWYHPENGLVQRMTMQASMKQTTEPIKKDGSEIKDYERESSEVTLTASLTRKEPKPAKCAVR